MPIFSLDKLGERITPVAQKYGVEKVTFFDTRVTRGEDSCFVGLLIDKGDLKGWQIGGLYEDLTIALAMPIDLVMTGSPVEQEMDHRDLNEHCLYDRSFHQQTTIQTLGM